MVGVLPGSVRKAETLKNLQSAALQTVGLTGEDLAVALLDYAHLHALMPRKPCRCHVSKRLDMEIRIERRSMRTQAQTASITRLQTTYPAGPAPTIRTSQLDICTSSVFGAPAVSIFEGSGAVLCTARSPWGGVCRDNGDKDRSERKKRNGYGYLINGDEVNKRALSGQRRESSFV